MFAAARQRLIPKTVSALTSGRRSSALLSTQTNTSRYVDSDNSALERGTSCSVAEKEQPITVCAMNNHPDYRLKLARERMQTMMKSPSSSPPPSSSTAMTFMKPPAPRKSDDSSSGATTERRLWKARQKMLEKMASLPPQQYEKRAHDSPPHENRVASLSFRPLPVPQKNDGSSSGFIAEKRLREKRLEIFSKLESSVQLSSKEEQSGTSEKKTTVFSSAAIASSVLPPPRVNDGSSSGAITEKRLREKRQAILNSMASTTQISSAQHQSTIESKPIPSASIAARALPKPRKNDGSSSGALTEQRLRDKRQAILDSLASPPQVSSAHDQNKIESKHIPLASVASKALPKPRMNDGSSSGALTERRLREKRQAILDKMAGM